MSKQKIANEAKQRTLELRDKAPNPYHPCTMEYRFWQDGVREGIHEVWEQEGVA